jgi:hypothetical protein
VGVDGQRYAVGGLQGCSGASGAASQKERGGEKKDGSEEATVEHGRRRRKAERRRTEGLRTGDRIITRTASRLPVGEGGVGRLFVPVGKG